MRKKISTLLTISATAIALLLLASPLLLLSSPLLQPVQAQTPMTFYIQQAQSADSQENLTLNVEAHGTNSTGTQTMNGSLEVENGNEGGDSISGNVEGGRFTNSSDRESIYLVGSGEASDGTSSVFSIQTDCGDSNSIDFSFAGTRIEFVGGVSCIIGGGEGEALGTQPTSSTPMTATTTSQDRGSSSSNSSDSSSNTRDGDSDSDGIPDSSDNCPNHSHHRCFKDEGDASSTTTSTSTSTNQQQQQPQSSSNGSGNQTR